jgi:hypothetical protein
MVDVWAVETLQRVGGVGVELEGGGWQLGRMRGLDSFLLPPLSPSPLLLPSGGPELWWQRVDEWGDSLAGLEASTISPSSLSALPTHGHV